jgi:hypothetical protein
VSGVFEVHEQVTDSLGQPGMSGVRGGAKYAYPPAGMVDDGENVLALTSQSDPSMKSIAKDRLSLRTQEVRPGSGRPARSRINAGGLKDLPHRGGCDRDSEKRIFAVNALILHEGCSATRVNARRRTDATVRGRPGPRFTLARAWRRFIKSRCHLNTVFGLTRSPSPLNVERPRGTSKAASNALSSRLNRGH